MDPKEIAANVVCIALYETTTSVSSWRLHLLLTFKDEGGEKERSVVLTLLALIRWLKFPLTVYVA